MTFLVVGEALMDVVRTETPPAIGRPGGSPMNVAVGLGRLGRSVALLAELGSDDWGDQVVSHLEQSGVEFVGARRGRTSSATATIRPDGSASYEFDVRWAPSLGDFRVDEHDGVHVGSVAAFMEPGCSTVRRVFAASRGLHSFDPNVRAELMPERSVAREMFTSIARDSDLVKMSDEDAAWLFPGEPPRLVARTLVERGVPVVAITEGSRGAHLHTWAATVDIAPRPVRVADTIGAGDAFMVGLIDGVTSLTDAGIGLDRVPVAELQKLGDHAAMIAAATVERRGADLPWAAELV